MKKIKAMALAVMLVVLTVVDSVLGLTNITVEASSLLQISVDTVEAKQSDKDVQVAVRIKNPNKVNIGALALEVTWDKTALKATSAVAGEFMISEESEINTTKMSEGFIGYADASAAGVTTEGQMILMTFDVLDEAKEGLNSINVKVLSAASATPEGDNQAPAITDIAQVSGGIKLSNASTQTPLKISVDTVDAKQGQKDIQVAVNVENPDKINIGAIVLEVTWDKTALKATKAVEGEFVLSSYPAINEERISEGFIGYADASATGVTTEGQIILMTFDVLDGAKEGLNSINVKVLSAASAVPEGDNLAPAITDITEVNGGIKLSNTSIQAPLKVSVDTVEVKQSQKNIQVAVNVENPDKINLGSLMFEVTWDSTALKATNAVKGEFILADPVINTEKISEGYIKYVDATSIGKIKGGQAVIITFDVLNEAKIGLNPINVKVLIAASADSGWSAITNITEVGGGINVACIHSNIKDSDYKVTKVPTCTEEGIEEATCPDCGTKLTRVVDKLICTHANVKDSDYKVTKVPTYTEEGIEEAICPDCGTKLTRAVDKLICTHANVKDSDYKVTKEPTVTEEGIEEAICPDCGIKLTHLIKKIEYGDVNADGSINIQDGIILKKHLAGIKGLKINLEASNVKAGDDINIQDAIILLKYLAGMNVTLGK